MLRDELENQKLRPFLSIRWKLFLALTCLIVLIHGAFAVGFYNFQKKVFQQNTNVLKAEQINSLDRLLNSSSASLLKTLQVLALSHRHELHSSTELLRSEISDHFAKIAISQMANSVSLYAVDGSAIEHWGQGAALAKQQVLQSLSTAEVSAGINCQQQCSLFVVSPVVVDKKILSILVIQQLLKPLLSQFSRENQLEIGLFREFPGADEQTNWQRQIFNITHSNLNIPLLVRLSASQSPLEFERDYLLSAFDSRYTVSFENPPSQLNHPVKWLFIQDVTHRANQFDQAIQSIYLWGLFSLVSSLMLLYIIVNRISHQLPRILAMSQAIGLEEDVIGSVNQIGDRRILDDELQQYDRQLAKISHKMDVLRQAESNNAIKLQSMVRELNQTKNFIDRLLNDEQPIILVQKLGGEIIALNQPGCKLFEIDNFSGLTYAEIFCSDLLEEDGLAALNYLYLGGETLVKAEAQWRNSKGDIYIILWVHALLSVPGTIDPVILSICVDITAQRKAEDRLEWLAFNDPSLINYNKQVFLEYLPFAISRSLERHKILALLYCEVTGLPKHIGAENLDLNSQILESLSERMSDCLRQYDMLTQLSDDHFVIILEGLSDISDAEIVTDKIISRFQQGVDVYGKEYFLDVTIGASYAPEHTESVPELLRNAEMAMFQAKRKKINFSSAVISENS